MLALTSLLEPAARARAFSNQPELRRTLILSELQAARVAAVQRVEPEEGMCSGLDRACELGVATADLIDLLRTGHAHWSLDSDSDKDFASDETERKDGLVPYFFTRTRPARRDDLYQRLAWHATDRATPLYSDTASTLEADAAVVCHAAERAAAEETLSMYVLTTMPGHHAAADHYGGYCFVNWAALLVRLLEDAGRRPFVVDVDYHAGDGTAEILGPSKMVSLHCAEDYPYRSPEEPWAIALPKQTTWAQYEPRLREALARRPPACGALCDPPHCRQTTFAIPFIHSVPDCCFILLSTDVLVVSLGLDALAGDPDSRRGHGFALSIEDYGSMGALIRRAGLQTLVLQEGGYDLARVPSAVRAFISALGGGGTKL